MITLDLLQHNKQSIFPAKTNAGNVSSGVLVNSYPAHKLSTSLAFMANQVKNDYVVETAIKNKAFLQKEISIVTK